MKRTSVAAMAISFVAACSGKTLLVGSNDGGEATSDGAVGAGDSGGGVDGSDAGNTGTSPSSDPWFCLSQPSEVTDPNLHVTITFKVFNPLDPVATAPGASDLTATTYVGVPGISVEACSALIGNCQLPAGPPEVTDDAGQATVVVPDDFAGYVAFTGAGYEPTTLYMGQLAADASTLAPPIEALGTTLLPGLSEELGVQVEPEAGLAFFEVYDCFDNHQPGVAFTLNPDPGANAVTWYAQGEESLPSKTASMTDQNGAAGVVNLPPGSVTLTAVLVASQRVIGSTTALISPGSATTVWIRARSH